ISRQDNQGTIAYYLYNGHGDAVNLISINETILNEYDFSIYGLGTQTEEGIFNPFRYAGEYYDQESGLYYLRARYYDPSISRFITEDTYKGDVTNPLTLNLYTYCLNNPIIRIDPTGHDSWVLYDPNNFGKQAKSEAERLSELYGTKTHMLEVTLRIQFLKAWNSMGKDTDIEGVSLLFHGSPHTINIDASNNEYLTSLSNGKTPLGTRAMYIGNLNDKAMDKLIILTCNGGHLDHTNDNVASTFLRTNDNINEVYAMDGNLSYNFNKSNKSYKPRLSFDQMRFLKNLNYLWIRFPFGMIKYNKNDGGDIYIKRDNIIK
ncbi:RHS repeat-associated core domain-containing protein, partial [Sporosalibacterium faouarense]|uniref:RHS repeat-associated core domain-containing protein n=1 Tax=Sporosalibacterium faouarense TaxID=516123 RepID=UPI00192BD9A4